MSDAPSTSPASDFPALRRPMRPRDPQASHRAATPLELFFDLVFVVAIAQAAAGLHHAIAESHVAAGVGSYAMVFFAIWWAWINFTWFASAYDSDDALYRITVFIEFTGALVLAAGVSAAFEEGDFATVVAGYTLMRVGIVTNWIRASLGDPARRTTCLRYAGGLIVVQLGWIGLVWGLGLSLSGFLALLAVELAIPAWAERAGPTPWHPHHITERYGLLTIIVLGESVLAATVSIGAALAGGQSFGSLLPTIGGGLLVLYSMWWFYFDRPVHDLLTSLPRAFVWGYGHYLVYASAAAVGAGLAVNTDFVTDHAAISGVVAGATVAVPAAIYVVVLWILHHRPRTDNVSPGWLVLAAPVLLLATPWTPSPVLACGLVLAGMLAVKLSLRHRHARRTGATAGVVLLLAGASACGGESPPPDDRAPEPGTVAPSADPPSPPSSWAYRCPDGLRFTVHYRADAAQVDLPARGLTLPGVPSASGARYQEGDVLFRDRAGEALLEVGSERHEGCRGERATSPEDAARLLGFDFRGLGQEPGWLVDVDVDRQVRWVGDYGEVRFATAAPETVEQGGGAVVWEARSDGHEIRVEADTEPCRDAMSGQPFTHTVRVRVDGSEYRGCGRWLDTGSGVAGGGGGGRGPHGGGGGGVAGGAAADGAG